VKRHGVTMPLLERQQPQPPSQSEQSPEQTNNPQQEIYERIAEIALGYVYSEAGAEGTSNNSW
jgi:hypothetical protein